MHVVTRPVAMPNAVGDEFDDASFAVTGMLVRGPRVCSVESLQALPAHDLGPTEILCFTGRPVARVESYVGARLIDILDACGFSEHHRSKLKRSVIVAEGQDGYRAIFSWSELYNSAIGEKVLALYEKNGRSLDPHLGRICLISANDARLGPRHLRGLCQVSVQML